LKVQLITEGKTVPDTKNFTIENSHGKKIEFRFIAVGAPYGLKAINNSNRPLWEVSCNGSTIGQWFIETIADHYEEDGWCLDGGNPEYDLDPALAAIAKENSIKALETELETARAAVVDYLKGFNINDTEQVRQMAQLKIKVQRLEEKVTR
jgi:hypothetical protein